MRSIRIAVATTNGDYQQERTFETINDWPMSPEALSKNGNSISIQGTAAYTEKSAGSEALLLGEDLQSSSNSWKVEAYSRATLQMKMTTEMDPDKSKNKSFDLNFQLTIFK